MNMINHNTKALALFSGGLDSMVAVCLIREQGIHVEGLFFESAFFSPGQARESADLIGLKLHIIDFNPDILKILKKPQYGFGKNLNPCLDCHMRMIERTRDLLKELNGDFIITGEVLEERPKSQNYRALQTILKNTNTSDLLVRPLSALKLKPTKAELDGLVDRNRLMGISGRSRKQQMDLAEKFGIKKYPTPAGGCLLTIPNFTDRMRPVMKQKELTLSDVKLLKCGRHFFHQEPDKRIVVGRDMQDNLNLLKCLEPQDLVIFPEDMKGPVTIIRSSDEPETLLQKSGSLTLRYSKGGIRQKPRTIQWLTINSIQQAREFSNSYENSTDEKLEFPGLQTFQTEPDNPKNLEVKWLEYA